MAAKWVIIDVRTGDITGTGSSNIGCRKQVEGLWGEDAFTSFGVDGDRAGKIVQVKKGDPFPFQAVSHDREQRPDALLCAPIDHPLAGAIQRAPIPGQRRPPPVGRRQSAGGPVGRRPSRPAATEVGPACTTCIVFAGHYGPCPPERT